MSKIPQYRHELKYYINQGAYTFLSKKLSLTMEQDKYARKNGGEYLIRSLYLDDMDDSAYARQGRIRSTPCSCSGPWARALP